MKVSIGSRVIDGPWGGGNLFVINLKKFLIRNGHQVVHDLCDRDVDIILLTDPRSRKESSSTFNNIDIMKYKKYVNPNVVVIQRINECDERKGTNYINKFYLQASKSADHVIFVSNWLREIYLNIGMPISKTSVIMSGADSDIFNDIDSAEFSKDNIKFVTHHWSSHVNKGFDIYLEFDAILDLDKYKNIEFTYIGNVPPEIKFKNINIKNPLFGKKLADEIKSHHIYLTAEKKALLLFTIKRGANKAKNIEIKLRLIFENFNLFNMNININMNANKMSDPFGYSNLSVKFKKKFCKFSLIPLVENM